ncbi:hypothetical protein Btru_052278 [Bulinus truncatus]|nr:hypothetical protein Btru_052278 [Bulinus truncatus]
MGPNSSPCLTLLTALVSITSALGMFNNPRDTDKYQHDLLDTLVHVMAKGEGRSLQDVLREAFLTRPYQLEGYDGYNFDMDDPLLNDGNDYYNTLLQMVTFKDMYPDYEEEKEDIDDFVETAKRENLSSVESYAPTSGVIYGPTNGVIYGPTSGVIYGPTSGVIYGPTSGVIYGPTSGVIYGPTSGVIYGPTSGVIYGPTSGVIYGLSLLSVE